MSLTTTTAPAAPVIPSAVPVLSDAALSALAPVLSATDCAVVWDSRDVSTRAAWWALADGEDFLGRPIPAGDDDPCECERLSRDDVPNPCPCTQDAAALVLALSVQHAALIGRDWSDGSHFGARLDGEWLDADALATARQQAAYATYGPNVQAALFGRAFPALAAADAGGDLRRAAWTTVTVYPSSVHAVATVNATGDGIDVEHLDGTPCPEDCGTCTDLTPRLLTPPAVPVPVATADVAAAWARFTADEPLPMIPGAGKTGHAADEVRALALPDVEDFKGTLAAAAADRATAAVRRSRRIRRAALWSPLTLAAAALAALIGGPVAWLAVGAVAAATLAVCTVLDEPTEDERLAARFAWFGTMARLDAATLADDEHAAA